MITTCFMNAEVYNKRKAQLRFMEECTECRMGFMILVLLNHAREKLRLRELERN